MHHRMGYFAVWLGLCVIAAGWSGCSRGSQVSVTVSSGSAESHTAVPTGRLAPTHTQTSSDWEASSPSTPSPTPPPIGLAPATVDIGSAKSLERFPSMAEACSPPCWNGLVPGTSLVDQVPILYATLGIDPSGLPLVELDSEHGLMGTYGFFAQGLDGVSLELVEVSWIDSVESIQLWYTRNPNMSLEEGFLHPHQLSSSLGTPHSILMYVEQDTRYEVFLAFEDAGTAVLYEGFLTVVGGSSNLCLSDKEGVTAKVRLYPLVSDTPLSALGMSANASDLVQPVNYTRLDEEAFFSKLVAPGTCIAVVPVG